MGKCVSKLLVKPFGFVIVTVSAVENLADRAVDVYMANSNQDDLKSKITGNFGRITTKVLAGWWEDSPLDEDMVDKGLLIGESYNLFNYVGFKAHELLELVVVADD